MTLDARLYSPALMNAAVIPVANEGFNYVTGNTGATGATGPTGPTGPTGAGP